MAASRLPSQTNQVFTTKCVLLGDPKVGKSCLIAGLAKKPTDTTYRPTMVDMSSVRTLRDNRMMLVDFWDTPGEQIVR